MFKMSCCNLTHALDIFYHNIGFELARFQPRLFILASFQIPLR